MSAHVLLNLLNELRKRYKLRSMSILLSLFRNKLNNAEAHVTLYLSYDRYNFTIKLRFWRENFKCLPYVCDVVITVIT